MKKQCITKYAFKIPLPSGFIGNYWNQSILLYSKRRAKRATASDIKSQTGHTLHAV